MFPVSAVGRVGTAGSDPVAVAVRVVAQVRPATHDAVRATRRTGRVDTDSGGARTLIGVVGKTSRRTIPTRCRWSRRARTRSEGTTAPAPCRRTDQQRYCRQGTRLGRRSSGARHQVRGRHPTESDDDRARRVQRAPTGLRSVAEYRSNDNRQLRRPTSRARPGGRAGRRSWCAARRGAANPHLPPDATKAPRPHHAWARNPRATALRTRTTTGRVRRV